MKKETINTEISNDNILKSSSLPENKEYYELIEKCASAREYLEISNGNATHATFLLTTFFRHAKSKILIFTGKLYSGVYDNENLVKEAIEFLRKNSSSTIKIVFQKSLTEECIFQKKLIKDITNIDGIKNRLVLFDASELSIEEINHFACMDDAAYRFELSDKLKKAVANFGDKKSTRVLTDLFSSICDRSKAIEVSV